MKEANIHDALKIRAVEIDVSLSAASNNISSYIPDGATPISFIDKTTGFSQCVIWWHPNNHAWMLTVRNWYTSEIQTSGTISGVLYYV